MASPTMSMPTTKITVESAMEEKTSVAEQIPVSTKRMQPSTAAWALGIQPVKNNTMTTARIKRPMTEGDMRILSSYR